MKQFFQDGAEFTDVNTREKIASYPNVVEHDFDMVGAILCRMQFEVEHPEYKGGATI